MDRLKPIFEGLTHKDRFSGREMYESIQGIIENDPQTRELLSDVRSKLGESTYRYTLTGIARNVFLIELVNDEISSTKMEVRWTIKASGGKKQEQFDETDPRFCEFEGCKKMWSKTVKELHSAVQSTEIINLLNLYEKYSVLAYEVPFDYKYSPVTMKTLHSIHNADNTFWLLDEKYQRTLKLRAVLLDENKHGYAHVFGSILKDKIKVKAYLTDRVQTGKHKTNREKRWEVHPESVHFAFRRDCLEIEYILMCQLTQFEDFPEDLFGILKQTDPSIQRSSDVFRCPVTLKPLSFPQFQHEVQSPNHGRSDFPVGHLNPLKKPTADPMVGHTAKNISWFSADGNRIQGSLSLKETKELLLKIWENYQKFRVSY